MQDRAGIYVFWRIDEKTGEKHAYLGQSVKILTRCADHLAGHKQHIDNSLHNRGLYSEENPYGWTVAVACYCDKSQLDEYEQAYIKAYQEKNINLYNVTGGGQFDKAEDINNRLETNLKRYRSGKTFGFDKCREQVKTYFDKYLDYTIKPPTNKIKERTAEEFRKFLEEDEQ